MAPDSAVASGLPEPPDRTHGVRRVGLLLPNLDGGGAELVVLRLAEGLLERGVCVDLLLGRADGEHLCNVPSGANIIGLNVGFPVFAWKFLGLVRYLRSARPSAFIASLDVIGVSVWACLVARTNTPLVLWIHTVVSRLLSDTCSFVTAPVRRLAIRLSYQRADALVAVSAGAASDVARLAGVPSNSVHIIYNPVVNSRVFRMALEPVDHPWFEPGQPPVIIGVGRLVRNKDFATLVRAFAEVRCHRHARLILLGRSDPREPEVRGELEQLAIRLGVSTDVALIGFVENPYCYMARSAVLALTSHYEGFGMVLAEALAVGTSVVATDCPSGPAEILEHGRYGRLVPVGDSSALAEAILTTLARPMAPETLRERGSRFSQSHGTEQHLRVLHDVVRTAIQDIGV